MITLLHSPTFIILEIGFATLALFTGLRLVMDLAISVAVHLEPRPPHPDQFYALRGQSIVAALFVALGFGLLALFVALASI